MGKCRATAFEIITNDKRERKGTPNVSMLVQIQSHQLRAPQATKNQQELRQGHPADPVTEYTVARGNEAKIPQRLAARKFKCGQAAGSAQERPSEERSISIRPKEQW